MTNQQDRQPRILLGQLGSYGDCLYATAIARQIKQDYSNCHLTWCIGEIYADVLNGNPFVDHVWVYPISNREQLLSKWHEFENTALQKAAAGEFDQIFLTQVFPANLKYFDGTLRSSQFRSYRHTVTVPVSPVLFLSNEEVENVRQFAELHQLPSAEEIVLFECHAASQQSRINLDKAVDAARQIIRGCSSSKIIISSSTPFKVDDPGIIDGSVLSFRENAELTKYCSLLIGVSSGISWLSTSTWAKTLPTIQVLNPELSFYASMKQDHQYFGLPADHLVEMQDTQHGEIAACALTIFEHGTDAAREQFETEPPECFNFYFNSLRNHVANSGKIGDMYHSIYFTWRRFGLSYLFLRDVLAKSLKLSLLTLWVRLTRKLRPGSAN